MWWSKRSNSLEGIFIEKKRVFQVHLEYYEFFYALFSRNNFNKFRIFISNTFTREKDEKGGIEMEGNYMRKNVFCENEEVLKTASKSRIISLKNKSASVSWVDCKSFLSYFAVFILSLLLHQHQQNEERECKVIADARKLKN